MVTILCADKKSNYFKVEPGTIFKNNSKMTSSMRSRMPLSLCEWFIKSVLI